MGFILIVPDVIVLTVLLVFALFAFGFATELVESVRSVLPM